MAALQHMLETGQGAVLDRSIFSDWVFAEKNRLDGNIDSEGFFYYSRLRDQMLEGLPFPHVTVYLDVSASECFSRIHGLRKRAAEVDSGIPLEYLAGLERCYNQFLDHMSARGSNVLRLDWTSFGTADGLRSAVLEAASTSVSSHKWDSAALSKVLGDSELLAARLRSTIAAPGMSKQDDSDDEALARVDLNSSNNLELQDVQPLSAPSSPQQSMD